MNEVAIKKYFEKQYKDGKKIYATRLIVDSPEFFLVTDGHVVFCQSIMTSKLLESRAIFPKFPDKDLTFTYEHLVGCAEGGPKIISVWESAIADSIPAEVSAWCNGGVVDKNISRVFILQDGRHVFVNQKFLDLLTTAKECLADYQYRARSPLSPILVARAGEPCALLMPIRPPDLEYLNKP